MALAHELKIMTWTRYELRNKTNVHVFYHGNKIWVRVNIIAGGKSSANRFLLCVKETITGLV